MYLFSLKRKSVLDLDAPFYHLFRSRDFSCLTNHSQLSAATLQPIAQKRIKTSLYNALYNFLAVKVFSLA